MISDSSLRVCSEWGFALYVQFLCNIFIWKLCNGCATIAHQICNCCVTIVLQLCIGCAVDMGLRGKGAHPQNFRSQATRNTNTVDQIQLLESPIPTPATATATLSQKASSGNISGTKRGIIDPLVSKMVQNGEKMVKMVIKWWA